MSDASAQLLDERALRRDGFVEGVPIVLSDGQTWHFPRPVLTGFYPVPEENGRFRMVSAFDVGDEFGVLYDEFVQSESGLEERLLMVSLAWHLLSKNYALVKADLGRLLRMVRHDAPDADGNTEMWTALFDVVLGRSPKHTPVG